MGKYLAPALDKGLDILEYLSEVAIPQSQVEISQGLDKSPNEIYRMLVCLEERGYLIKSTSGRYSLSLKLYQLSHRHSPIDGLLKASKPFMEELSNTTRQSCHLSILYNNKLMVVAQYRSPDPVSLSIAEGSLFPLVKTTSGKVLLANMNDEAAKNILHADSDFKGLSKNDARRFYKHLTEIKSRGFEIEESQITIGVTNIAVSIGDGKTGTHAVLAISSLTSITDKNNSGEFFTEKIKNAANSINEAIGVR